MAGPKIPWRPGRIDGFAAQVTPDGRLPDAAQGADHLRAIFYRMGYEAYIPLIPHCWLFLSSFNDQEIVALAGAHALGRCHTDRSGFEGPWTFSPTTVTNDFFQLLFSETWVWKKWSGPKQLEDKKTKTLMMLPWVLIFKHFNIDIDYFSPHLCSTDYVLVQDKSFKKFAKAYADSQDLWFKEYVCILFL